MRPNGPNGRGFDRRLDPIAVRRKQTIVTIKDRADKVFSVVGEIGVRRFGQLKRGIEPQLDVDLQHLTRDELVELATVIVAKLETM